MTELPWTDLPWTDLPRLSPPAPVLALHATADGVWLGGPGGAALLGSALLDSDLLGGPAAVAGLATSGRWLLAGGVDGLARTDDLGETWEKAAVAGVPAAVSCLVVLPGTDGVALAGTLGGGVLRTADHGRSWEPASFGLPGDEVTALLAGPAGTAYAGTPDGLYRSTTTGRTWRPVPSVPVAVAALAAGARGGVLAAFEDGGFAAVDEPGRTDDFLLADAVRGVLRWSAGGITRLLDEPAFALAEHAGTLYAGTVAGLLTSDDGGRSWAARPVPGLDDARTLLAAGAGLFAAGTRTGIVRLAAGTPATGTPATGLPAGLGWVAELQAPFPVTAAAVAGDGALVAAGPGGLFRRGPLSGGPTAAGSADWVPVARPAAVVHLLAFGPHRAGVAAGSGGTLLLSADDGRTWQQQPSPFGAVPPAAVRPTTSGIVAVQHDARHGIGHLWTGSDGEWIRGPEISTKWPHAAILADPELVGLGRYLYGRDDRGRWVQRAELAGGIRVLAGAGPFSAALTSAGLWLSGNGRDWLRADGPAPQGVALESDAVTVVYGDGRVRKRALAKLRPS